MNRLKEIANLFQLENGMQGQPKTRQDELFEQAPSYLKELEGVSDTVYSDTRGLPTIGSGFNLNSPATKEAVSKQGVDVKKLLAGEPLDDEKATKIQEDILKEKYQYLNNIRNKDFPTFDGSIDQELVLLGLMYQNPSLMGPNMRKALMEGNEEEAAKEILLRSNKNKDPGIQRRRVLEADKFLSRERFGQMYENLSDDEKTQVVNLLEQIQSPGTKDQLYRDYPFLKELAPRRSFKKIPGLD